MDRKLIFLDIDGTILAHGEEVHPAVLEGLRRARNKGHMVFISTGRSHGSVPPEILDMETICLHIKDLRRYTAMRSLIWRQMV